ncbi:MAG: aminotransferase class III-fold pyridoxal phosphate-dependent enzyme, partial [Saprospiraceae bacterium]|nr:aminotransferase class III-fold pyridoxal phosphate-dependent enzyme [Saprospiraceae bacterium]
MIQLLLRSTLPGRRPVRKCIRLHRTVAQQAATLEHVILAGFTHEPAVKLAERLLALAGAPYAKVLYADSGSSAIEIALKLSFHYWRNCGQPARTRFVVLEGGY